MEEIRKVIELYVEGTRKGDVDLLRSVFHEKAIMSGDLGEIKMVLDSPEHFFRDIDGQVASEAYSYEIYAIAQCADIASARLKENNLKGQNFMNLFQLQKINGEWKIISKLFTSTQEGLHESV